MRGTLAALAWLLAAGAALASPAQASAGVHHILVAPVLERPADVVAPERLAAASPPDGPALPTIQDGIGTGSGLQQRAKAGDAAGFICTGAFLLRDPATATYYLSTAGHCLVRDETDPTPHTAADPDKLNQEILVCVAGCLDNALGLGTYVTLTAGPGYQPVAFAQSGGVGLDFGIIELPASVHDKLRPWMPQWGGPDGIAAPRLGDLMAHYGHGSYCCPAPFALATRTPADQGRLAVALGSSGGSFDAAGQVTGGDSGSGIVLATPDTGRGVQGGAAAGVITHGLAGAGSEFSGTTLEKGLAMVLEHLGLRLELVLADDPLDARPRPFSPEVAILFPSPGAAVGPGGSLTVHGSAVAPDGSAAVQVAIDDPGFSAAARVPVAGLSSWNATWDLAGVAPGAHTIRVRLVADGAVLAAANQTVVVRDRASPASAPGAAPPGGIPVAGTAGAGPKPPGSPPDSTTAASKGTPFPALPAALAALLLAGLACTRGRRA